MEKKTKEMGPRKIRREIIFISQHANHFLLVGISRWHGGKIIDFKAAILFCLEPLLVNCTSTFSTVITVRVLPCGEKEKMWWKQDESASKINVIFYCCG